MAGNGEQFTGAVKPSSIEQVSYDKSLAAIRMTEIPSNMGKRLAYKSGGNGDGKVEYIGANDRGVDESTDGWLIQKLTYDASHRVISITIAYDSWDNREIATYG